MNDIEKFQKAHQNRFKNTLNFMQKYAPPPINILDIGQENILSLKLKEIGYKVTNTPKDVDLDVEYSFIGKNKYDLITAFEIFEHMVAPFNILREIKAPKLIASVPLKLWFTNAYWNEKDPWDRHYHEFEPRQFEMLLNKAGWKIIKSEKWVSPSNKIGIRPLLRSFTPRYYIVYCER
jgi:hypothetical protein